MPLNRPRGQQVRKFYFDSVALSSTNSNAYLTVATFPIIAAGPGPYTIQYSAEAHRVGSTAYSLQLTVDGVEVAQLDYPSADGWNAFGGFVPFVSASGSFTVRLNQKSTVNARTIESRRRSLIVWKN